MLTRFVLSTLVQIELVVSRVCLPLSRQATCDTVFPELCCSVPILDNAIVAKGIVNLEAVLRIVYQVFAKQRIVLAG